MEKTSQLLRGLKNNSFNFFDLIIITTDAMVSRCKFTGFYLIKIDDSNQGGGTI